MKIRDFNFIWNLWPPFLGLGISIESMSPDYRRIVIRLKKRRWNVNYFGTQFGGAIFSMTDGVHMLMLVRNLPKKYRIWDKSASIEYLRRGTTDLIAEFDLSERDLKDIVDNLESKDSMEWSRVVEVKDADGGVVARVQRTVSIRHK